MLIYKTRTMLANEFGVCRKTLRRRFDGLEFVPPPGEIDPRWQKYIYDCLYFPDGVNADDYEKVRFPKLVLEAQEKGG